MVAPSLPLEIISRIVFYLTPEYYGWGVPEKLASYACINPQWQCMVEKITFSSLNLTTARVSDLRRIVLQRRRSLVRKINLTVTLPGYSVGERAHVETDIDRARNNRVFTDTISTLFGVLSSWPTNDGYKSGIRLEIRNISPSDVTQDRNPYSRYLSAALEPGGTDIIHWRYMASYVELLKPAEELPLVPVVSELRVCNGNERNIAPATASKLISRLPAVRHWEAKLSDNERENGPLRDRLRNEFAVSLAQWPASLKLLYLEYPGEGPDDAACPLSQRSKPGADAFSIALRQLSQQLEWIALVGVMVGPELFWPQNDDDDHQPHWPNLRFVYITFATATPSGQWLFVRDTRYDSDPDSDPLPVEPPTDILPQDSFPDHYRTVPSPILNEHYIAAAYAAQHMPKLETMTLIGLPQTGLNGVLREGDLECKIRHEFTYERKEARARWESSAEFLLSDATREAWAATGSRHGHSKLIIENTVLPFVRRRW